MKTMALFLALTLPLATGCSSGSTPETPDASGDAALPCLNLKNDCVHPVPSYTTDIVPILQSRCAPCHFNGGIEAALYDFSTYAGVDNADIAIQAEIYACKMPPVDGIPEAGVKPGSPPLTDAQRATLWNWLVCGAHNN
jgi:hypothetical protein